MVVYIYIAHIYGNMICCHKTPISIVLKICICCTFEFTDLPGICRIFALVIFQRFPASVHIFKKAARGATSARTSRDGVIDPFLVLEHLQCENAKFPSTGALNFIKFSVVTAPS